MNALRRLWDTWPAFLARYYLARTWRDLPGPWPVKVALLALCLAIPGPFDELALIALPGALRKLRARTSP